VISGAASGIGRATALRLAAGGAVIAGIDRDAAGLAAVEHEVGAAGGRMLSLQADVTDLAAVERAVAVAVGELGGLEGAANVAGIGDFTGDVTEIDPDVWARVLAINLNGTFHVSRAVIPQLRERGGAIVNVSSQFGLVGCLSSPAYCASKAAVIGLTKAMAVDHASEGIRVNCVCPGPTDTPMLRGTKGTPELLERERARTEHRNLSGRLMRPEEIAATIAFLLSDDAASTTGSIVAVDGGWTAS
jgi:meso-butanediol dehydrogenase/(S,S)-butanediol dehydrogenase/diacetyl reductase